MKFDRLMARCTEMNLNIHNLMQTLTAIEFLYLQKNPEFISPTYPSIFIQDKTVSEGENVVDNEVEK